MNKRTWKLSALFLALVLALTGCNLIGVDPLMQIAEDRAALEKTYQATLAEYDGGSVSVFDIQLDFNNGWNSYYQMSLYGLEIDAEMIESLKQSSVQYALERVAIAREAEARGISLSEEEIAALEESIGETYDLTLEQYKAEMDGETDEIRTAQAEYYIYLNGNTYEAMLAYERAYSLSEKLRAALDAEVSEVSEEILLETYEQKLEDDETYYAGYLDDFEDDVTNGTLITWMPEGYRTVKHILLIPDAAVLDPYVEKKNQISTFETELAACNEELAAVTDDDASEGDPEAVRAEIAGIEASIAAAEAELPALEAACLNDVQDRIEQIQTRLDAGEDFQTLIDEFGEDPGMMAGAVNAGRGYFVSATSNKWDTAFRNAAMLLENVGDVSAPVLGMSGVHIIRYENDVAPGAVPFEDVRDELREDALATEQEEHYTESLAEWVEALNPVYYYDNWDPMA